MTFEKLALHPSILKAIVESGYTVPTPIQAQAIPQALAGHDLMASAQTGTQGAGGGFGPPEVYRRAHGLEIVRRHPHVGGQLRHRGQEARGSLVVPWRQSSGTV